MLTLDKHTIKPGAIALMVFMAATRFHHFGTPFALPDASLAVFFLAGAWFGGIRFFIALLIEAALIDFVAISQFNVSDFCISPAYAFLLPTYALMWAGGKWCRQFKTPSAKALALQFAALTLAATGAFIISNGSFNLLSGRYPDLTGTPAFGQLLGYYTAYMTPTLLYAAVCYAAASLYRALPVAWQLKPMAPSK